MQISGINLNSYFNNFTNTKTNNVRKSPFITPQLSFKNNGDVFEKNPLNKFNNFIIDEYKKLTDSEISQINNQIDEKMHKNMIRN